MKFTDTTTTLAELKEKTSSFVSARDWDQFHTPKNLAMSLAIEAAELMELFQWVESKDSEKELEKKREAVEEEVADILANLLSFCTHSKIDLARAFEKKMAQNNEKYPVEKTKGHATKYTDL